MKASPILTPVRARTASRVGLRNGQTQGLLAKNVLAGLGGLDAPGNVKMVGKRIVDRVDIGIGQKLLVRAIGRGNAKRSRRLPGLGKIARCNRGHSGVFALLHRWKDFLEADVCGAENSPAEFVVHENYDTKSTQNLYAEYHPASTAA